MKPYKGKSHDGSSLGDRMKEYESTSEVYLPEKSYIVIRLDGHRFSKYTKDFSRPFDRTFSNAMQEVTVELCKEFGAITGYTQSDEITLILAPKFSKDHSNQIYKGRVSKLTSLTASFASVKFNNLMKNYAKKDGWFDSRAYGVDTIEEATNSIIWRSRDAIKNSKAMFAQTYCNHKTLLNKNSQEQIEICKELTGKDWEVQSSAYKYGTLVKKIKVLKYSVYLDDKVLRTKFNNLHIPMNTFSEELCTLIGSEIKEYK